MLNLLTEFQNIVNTLEEEKIEYAICGGIAMAIHGFLRTTVDIDIVVLQENVNITKQVIRKHGFSIESNPMIFGTGDTIIHRITKIDSNSEDFLVLDILEVTDAMKELWESRVRLDSSFGSLSVINKQGLIQMKKKRNSKIDQEDIERLEADE
jgi:hypothetical protein